MSSFNPIQSSGYPIWYKIKSRLWGVINLSVFRWTPYCMRRFRVLLLKIFGADIDWTCSISRKAIIVDPWNFRMGRLSSIDEGCCLRCRDLVSIGERCCISSGVYILTGSHDISSPYFEMITSPIVINDNVWIATKAMIGRGVTIGEGAVVASYANVVKDVGQWTVVGGNPAKFIKNRVLNHA